MLPICYDLYCGLGGAEGFLSEGFRCIGYDIEKHDYGTGTYPGELILADVRSIHGSQLADAACIVASPPCQEPSYRAMPWKRAKALLVMENVVGAQRWVGRARWHFGSYYLWGDVPALMPATKPAWKAAGQNWNEWKSTDKVSPHWKLQGTKQPASNRLWYDVGIASLSSDSAKRKAASAEIAKIPFPLAQWIARCYKPVAEAVAL